MVQRLARVNGRELNEDAARAVAGVMRALYGPGWAILWSLARGNTRPHPIWDTAALGTLIWAFEIGVLPTVGATPPLRRWPAGDAMWDLVQCLVFATVTTGALAALRRVRRAHRLLDR